eukprot:scaffold54052_cov57-Phaeocystis_antarctica.AAC.2
MATVYPAARNLFTAVTYTRPRNCSLPIRALQPPEDITQTRRRRRRRTSVPFALGRFNWAGLYQLGVYGVNVGRELPRR